MHEITDKVECVVCYLFKKYPSTHEVSPRRLLIMLYLADWKSAIEDNNQITQIKWSIKNDLPTPNMEIDNIHKKYRRGDCTKIFLSSREKKILNFVVKSASSKDLNSLIRLTYSTYPILSHREPDKLDLVQIAEKYKLVKPLLV